MHAGDFHFYDIATIAPLIESGHTVLTPTARLARRIKTEWDRRQSQAGLRSWAPAPVMALETWLMARWEDAIAADRVPAHIVLDAAREQELWLQIITDDMAAAAEYSLLQPRAAAQLAAATREDLLRWQVDMDSSAVQADFRLDPDCGAFLRWQMHMQRRLRAEGLETRAGCLRDLSSVQADTTTPVALLAFDDIPPLYRRCLERLAEPCITVLVPGQAVTIEPRSYADRASELGAIARWARIRVEAEPDATIGIVLTDMQRDRTALEHLLRREFDCLGDDYASLPVNFSAGISLDQAPAITAALMMIACGGQSLPLADVVTLAQSRFRAQDDGFSPRMLRLIRQLYRDGQDPVPLAHLRYRARSPGDSSEAGTDSTMGQCLGKIAERRLQRQRQRPSQWVETFCSILDDWGWPGPGPLDSLEYQQVERWYEALDAFATYDHVSPAIDFDAATAMLRRCCESRISQPQTADAGIQVLGPLEAAGLAFAAIWVCGLEAGRFPAPPRPNPLIPAALQRQLDMPHASADREWRFAAVLLEQFRRGAGEVIASFSRFTEGTPNLPSPLLASQAVTAFPGDWVEPEAWSTWSSAQEFDDDRSAPVLSPEEADGLVGGSGVLEDQSRCPFRAFARRRLRLDPLDAPLDGLSAADRGNLVHAALYIFWGDIRDSAALAALSPDERAHRLDDCARQAIEQLPAGRRLLVGGACLDLERKRLVELLLEWLALEDTRDPFTVIAREEPMAVSPAGLPLELRVDRIDELAAGERLLIDYKTGSASASGWYGARPSAPQLPLYTVASPAQGIAFASVRHRDSRFRGLGDVEGVPGVRSEFTAAVSKSAGAEDWPALCDRWKAVTHELAAGLIAGEAAVDPLQGACSYCGLQALCRVDDPTEEQA